MSNNNLYILFLWKFKLINLRNISYHQQHRNLMDKATAFKHLNMITLLCSLCSNRYPVYRILISRKNQELQQVTLASNPQNLNAFAENQGTFQGHIANSNDPNNEKTKQKQMQFYCLNCFASSKIHHSQVLPESYYDIAVRYIKQVPIPNYKIAEQCLDLVKQIQDKSNELCKQIFSQIDDFKFFILKLLGQTKKISSNYITKLKYFQNLRIQERIILQNSNYCPKQKTKVLHQLHDKFLINQDQYVIQLNKKFSLLKNMKQKIGTIKLIMPKFSDELSSPKRKKVFISDIPISSMINFKGIKYFGANDGCIYYDSMSEIMSLKAHQSLIRSFSHDNQYTLYSGSDDFTIKAWDTHQSQLQLIKVFGVINNNKSYHRNICVIDEGRTMISTRGQFDNFQLRLWSLQDEYKNIGCLDGHQSFIKAMVIGNKERDIVITASDDKKIKVWDTKNSRLLRTILRPKKISNILVSERLKLCAIMEQQNRVLLMDLTQYTITSGWTMPRKILTCCGYSKSSMNGTMRDNDYMGIGIPTNISIWRWDGIKLWSIDTQITYIPANMMQFSDLIITSNGTGTVDEFYVGDIASIEQEVMGNLLTTA